MKKETQTREQATDRRADSIHKVGGLTTMTKALQAMPPIQDLREYLNTDTPKAHAFPAKHVEKIVMEPPARTYVASGS